MLNGVKQDEVKENKESLPPQTLSALSAAMNSATAAVAQPAASATAMTPTAPQINAQLGSPEWQQAVSQQVLMFSRNGQQNAELRLHPDDLGAIQISLKLDNDRAQLNMISGHSGARRAGSRPAASAHRAGGKRHQPEPEQHRQRRLPAEPELRRSAGVAPRRAQGGFS